MEIFQNSCALELGAMRRIDGRGWDVKRYLNLMEGVKGIASLGFKTGKKL